MNTKTQIPSIYPIYLTSNVAYDLVEKFARNELYEATRFTSQHAKYSYNAKILESGDVEVSVHYDSDDGFCMQSGNCLRKTIRPYSEEQLLHFKQQQMFSIAETEYFRRQREQEIVEIMKIQDEIFVGTTFSFDA